MRRLALLTVVMVIGGTFQFVPAAAGGGGCYASGDPTSGRGFKGTSLTIEECMFTPTVVYVEVGTEVTWVNKDPVPHTVSGAGLSWGTHENLEKGDRVTHTFKNEGVFPYYCLLHPSMVAAVVVGDPTAGKGAALPIETDVEMMVDEETDGAIQTETELEAAPASTTEEGGGGAPWLLVLMVAILGAGVGGVLGRVRRSRAPEAEL